MMKNRKELILRLDRELYNLVVSQSLVEDKNITEYIRDALLKSVEPAIIKEKEDLNLKTLKELFDTSNFTL